MKDQDPTGVSPRTHEEHVRLVMEFADAMVRKLDANAGKVHWRNASVYYLMSRLHDELIELRAAVASRDPQRVRDEAADVGNFSAMVADLFAESDGGPGL